MHSTAQQKPKKSGGSKADFSIKKIFPWFILFFVGASLITTVCGLLPENSVTLFYSSQFVPFAKWLAKFFIAMAMGAIGLNTNIVKLIRNGGKPILLGCAVGYPSPPFRSAYKALQGFSQAISDNIKAGADYYNTHPLPILSAQT